MKSSGAPSADPGASPGLAIRALRLGKGLTLAQVSAKTGLAISTLSKLEKGHVALSYDKLMLLSKGLGVDIANLLDPQQQAAGGPALGSGRRAVQRVGDGQMIETSSYRQLYLATELLNKKITPMIVEIQARTLQEFSAEFGGLIRHPGEEFSLVLDGELEFHSELYAPLRLKEGDSIYFDSEMGHAYLKASEGRCRIVCTCAPRGDDVMTEMFVSASERHGAAVDPHAHAHAHPVAAVREPAARHRLAVKRGTR